MQVMKTMLRITSYLSILCFLILNINDEMAKDNHYIENNETRIFVISEKNILSQQIRIGIKNKSRRRLANSLNDERQL